jgi:hypothetical protein
MIDASLIGSNTNTWRGNEEYDSTGFPLYANSSFLDLSDYRTSGNQFDAVPGQNYPAGHDGSLISQGGIGGVPIGLEPGSPFGADPFGHDLGNDGGIGSAAGNFATVAGNKLIFDAYGSSGKLNNIRGSQPTIVKYPESLGTNPEVTQCIHFDFYYKKDVNIDTVTENIKNIADNIVENFENVVDFASGALSSVVSDRTKPAAEADGEVVVAHWSDVVGESLENLLNYSAEGIAQIGSHSQDVLTSDTRLSKAQVESGDKLSLYLPAGLKIGQSTTYDAKNMGAIRNLMGAGSGVIPGLSKAAAGFVDEAIGSVTGIELNTGSALNALTGTVANPRKEMMFNGTEIRSFDFNFQFRPKSKEEAKSMILAIEMLRFHALPEINPSMSFLSVPSEVQIWFLDYVNTSAAYPGRISGYPGDYMEVSKSLPRLGRCAITGVDVTYHPEANTVFEDGTPTMADVSLTLTELEPIARNHISQLGM